MTTLVTGAIGSLLPKLGELLKQEYDLQKGVKKKIRKLSQELEAAHAALRKIGDVPPDELDEQVRLWARDVREASYDMEDVVDTFLVRVVGAPDDKVGKLRRLRKKVGSFFKKSKARRKISGLIDDINEKLEEVATRRGRFKVDDIVAKPAATTTIDPRVLNLYKRAADLVGMERPTDELLSMLSLGGDDDDVSADKKLKIVSIVGFGGLGKTTLAKAVYDRVKPRFKCGAFVPVGRNPDIKKVLRDILIGLDKEKFRDLNMTMLDERQLMDELNEFIKEKRYFIVIDDIWDKGSLELISSALQGSNCGSKFIITTRISGVATQADEVYKMQPLSRDESEKLLFARISDSQGKYSDSPSVEACEKILKKCGGVPLAIITIASLLASKPGGACWSEVYNSIGFGHEDNYDVDNTRRILSFSYYDLPSHLKACLLYLSVFPEEAVIKKNNLIWKWIAEGFITEKQGAAPGVGLFELGERCFNELINRSMIQAQETRYEGYVDACSVHDIVLDLIHKLSREENFVTVLKGGERQKPQRRISRRLALQPVEDHQSDELANIDAEKVRSIFSCQCDFAALCPRFSFLRVVEMGRCSVSNNDCQKVMLDHLGSLLHLRYLRLENITELPREVRYLRFLQTLDLLGRGIEELLEEVGLLTQLVCLRADINKTLLAGLIGKLRLLQELVISSFHGDEDATMQFVKELGLLRELRVLETTIYVTSKSMQSALLESLGHLHNIQELCIADYLAYNKSCTSGAESVSFRHIRILHLVCLVFSRLPAWINSSLSPNLLYLIAKVRVVREQDMETLAKLPQLHDLSLHVHCTEVVSIKMATDGGVGYFHKLKRLRISGCSSVFSDKGSGGGSSRVPPNNTCMPSLESLAFDVHVRSLKDENLHLGFDKLLGFHNLGTSSLRRVTAKLSCRAALHREVEEAEAALEHMAAVHPKHPSLKTERVQTLLMISRYQEACMEVTRNPALVNAAWKSADNVSPGGNIRALRMPDPAASSSKVIRLLYIDDGVKLLSLSSNALHRLWWEHSDKNPLGKSSEALLSLSSNALHRPRKWEHSDKNPHGKSVALLSLNSKALHRLWKWEHSDKNPLGKKHRMLQWQPKSGIIMTNDTANGNPEEATACITLSNDDKYIISASGGNFLQFDIRTFEVVTSLMPPLPAATFLAFHPEDNDFIAIGRDDSSIQIYNVLFNEVLFVLMGHRKKITGLAFSGSMKVLVSSGADAQLCVWSIDDDWDCWSSDVWEKRISTYIQPPSNHSGVLVGDTMVQFHYDGRQILVVHETQLAIYDCQLECLCSWFPRDALPAPISSAVYSIGCLLVYAGFCDGAIGILKQILLHCGAG